MFYFQTSSSAQKSNLSNMLHNKPSVHKPLHSDFEKEKEEFWKKRLLHQNVSVEKVSCAPWGSGSWVCHGPGEFGIPEPFASV